MPETEKMFEDEPINKNELDGMSESEIAGKSKTALDSADSNLGSDDDVREERGKKSLAAEVKTKNDKEVLRDLGRTIHEGRHKLGLSQEELSKRSGISRYYISSIERGSKNVTVGVLRKLATVLTIPAWQILQKAEQ